MDSKKCAFGVLVGKIVGFIISEIGIEANPGKSKGSSRYGKPYNYKGGLEANWLHNNPEKICFQLCIKLPLVLQVLEVNQRL